MEFLYFIGLLLLLPVHCSGSGIRFTYGIRITGTDIQGNTIKTYWVSSWVQCLSLCMETYGCVAISFNCEVILHKTEICQLKSSSNNTVAFQQMCSIVPTDTQNVPTNYQITSLSTKISQTTSEMTSQTTLETTHSTSETSQVTSEMTSQTTLETTHSTPETSQVISEMTSQTTLETTHSTSETSQVTSEMTSQTKLETTYSTSEKSHVTSEMTSQTTLETTHSTSETSQITSEMTSKITSETTSQKTSKTTSQTTSQVSPSITTNIVTTSINNQGYILAVAESLQDMCFVGSTYDITVLTPAGVYIYDSYLDLATGPCRGPEAFSAIFTGYTGLPDISQVSSILSYQVNVVELYAGGNVYKWMASSTHVTKQTGFPKPIQNHIGTISGSYPDSPGWSIYRGRNGVQRFFYQNGINYMYCEQGCTSQQFNINDLILDQNNNNLNVWTSLPSDVVSICSVDNQHLFYVVFDKNNNFYTYQLDYAAIPAITVTIQGQVKF